MEGGVDGIALHGELAVTGDIVLPRQGQHALKQGLKVLGHEAAQLHQHAGAAAQVDIQSGDVGHLAVTVDAAVFGPHVLQLQAFHFVCHQTFQSEQAGDGQSHVPNLL